jgi:hypothetical protein
LKLKLSPGKFFKALFSLSIFLVGLGLLYANWMPQALNAYHFLMMIGFLILVTSIVHIILIKVSEGKPQKFIRVFMVATMLKLILYFVFILTMAFLYRDQAAGLLICFLILYLFYTTLEVYFLIKHLNSQST